MEKPRAPDAGKLHVLVVDDNLAALELIENWLTSAGYRVSTRSAAVGTAADVLELRPDVALIDVMMPGLRGDDLARLLKRHPSTRGVAVILHSAMAASDLRTMIMTTGALGAIEKTPNQALFLYAFNGLTAKLRGARSHDHSNAPATSGTFPIESRKTHDAAPVGPVPDVVGRRR